MSTADREIVTTRLINAPRELVFAAFTDPLHVGMWYGPDGFTTTTHHMDVRPGGTWRFVMESPTMGKFDNLVTYREVVPPERLVYDHGSGAVPDPRQFLVTITFADRGGKTALTMRSLFPTAAARDWVVVNVGAIEGAKQTLNRLEQFLATRV
jgi:uncharacterized protein YndB with AHSA1/START domain